MMTMNNLFIRRTVFACLLAIGLCTSVCGQETVQKYLKVSQIFKLCDKGDPDGTKIYTEEVCIQNHDGKDVFCTKMKVEYHITETSKKLVIKRKVLSSENSTLCDDKEQQLQIHPDVTSRWSVTSILKPRKLKAKYMWAILGCPVTQSADGHTIEFDKSESFREESFKLFGQTVSYDRSIERIQYKSADSYCFENIEKIVSEKDISVTKKNGTKHNITIVKTIVVL